MANYENCLGKRKVYEDPNYIYFGNLGIQTVQHENKTYYPVEDILNLLGYYDHHQAFLYYNNSDEKKVYPWEMVVINNERYFSETVVIVLLTSSKHIDAQCLLEQIKTRY